MLVSYKTSAENTFPKYYLPCSSFSVIYSESSIDTSFKTFHGALSTQTALLLFALFCYDSACLFAQTVPHLKIKVKPSF